MRVWFFGHFFIKLRAFCLLLEIHREDEIFFLRTYKLKHFSQQRISELSCLLPEQPPELKLAFLKAQFQDVNLWVQ